MTQYSKINVIYRLQRWLDSVPGQTFLNYAYSWGASIVILGALFTLTHLPGANIMIYIGMGTEVVVFFISAFDRPFDKTAIGKELPTHVGEVEHDGSDDTAEQPVSQGETQLSAPQNTASWITQQQQLSPDMEEATNNYVEELRRLTDLLSQVSAQSQRLTRDSEEMENLNRTLTGITRVYEMQLKSASSQIGTIDEINEQSRKMASQIEQLNRIYARMIEAMTFNMNAAAPQGAPRQV